MTLSELARIRSGGLEAARILVDVCQTNPTEDDWMAATVCWQWLARSVVRIAPFGLPVTITVPYKMEYDVQRSECRDLLCRAYRLATKAGQPVTRRAVALALNHTHLPGPAATPNLLWAYYTTSSAYPFGMDAQTNLAFLDRLSADSGTGVRTLALLLDLLDDHAAVHDEIGMALTLRTVWQLMASRGIGVLCNHTRVERLQSYVTGPLVRTLYAKDLTQACLAATRGP